MGRLLRLMVLCCALMGWASLASAEAFRYGDSGEEVQQIQEKLTSLGYTVECDGNYGADTEKAVMAFQTAKGLEIDGMVGEGTYMAMFEREMPEVSRGFSSVSRRIIGTSFAYLGTPYSFGGSSPDGFDCSGYVRFVFANAGIWLPRMADEQYDCGVAVGYGSMRSGDLVFFSTYEDGPSHVGIYLGNGQFIHASSSRGVVVDSLGMAYWADTYIGARRVI